MKAIQVSHYLVTALLSLTLTLPATALERTANIGADKADTIGLEMAVDTKIAALAAALNQLLRCNNKGMIFASNSSTSGRDADGCISGIGDNANDLVVRSENVTASIPNITYPRSLYHHYGQPMLSHSGGSCSGDWCGTATRTTSLRSYINEGATGISLSAERADFAACNQPINLQIANIGVAANGSFPCHYDSSPNRYHTLHWNYDPTTHIITWTVEAFKVKNFSTLLDTARIANVRVGYSVLRVRSREAE